MSGPKLAAEQYRQANVAAAQEARAADVQRRAIEAAKPVKEEDLFQAQARFEAALAGLRVMQSANVPKPGTFDEAALQTADREIEVARLEHESMRDRWKHQSEKRLAKSNLWLAGAVAFFAFAQVVIAGVVARHTWNQPACPPVTVTVQK